MPPGSARTLTEGERRGISVGLLRALENAGARPAIVPLGHPAARLAAVWRAGTPILTRGDFIWWPGAPADMSGPWSADAMAVLQHELQHVLDYRLGWLTGRRYLTHPRHWSYRLALSPDLAWDKLGAEQRAVAAERLWRAEKGVDPAGQDLARLRRLIPWA